MIVRVLSAAVIAAASGAVLDWVLPDWSAVVPAALVGGVTGAIGFRIEKVLLGLGFDPLIRESYEHTSRFRLAITPDWKWWMRPPYRLFRATIARPIGQANAPFDQEEVQDGVVSGIDTIDIDGDGTVDFRAWVRAHEMGDPLCIGIYTIQQIADLAYVSVGFPVPSGNFTATLLPSNNRDTGLLLSSDSDSPYSGHYISTVEEGGALTTLQLVTFGEQIDVFVQHGRLETEHRFYVGGTVLMTLHYQIERK